ncbi:MAG TPA: PQQ-binding-like beta-propeller repeat protein [Pseudonocardiaceae bacterium]|nr:PQQ-binding-like beta-propeller repeat protein [Pseudonocardiaceae bacterium]
MRFERIRRLLTGSAVLALTAVSLPGVGAHAATVPATTRASITDAAANGDSFDPTRAYVPGSPVTARPAATLPGTTDATTPPAPDANGGSLGFAVSGSLETTQGTPMTTSLPGGDTLQVYSLGVVNLVRPDGSTVWQRSTGSLYRDWHLTFDNAGYSSTPQLAIGTDPADPYELTTAEPYAERDTQPYAVGDLTGDGATDIAVAETVGINLGAANCGNCGSPFTVPGSDLHFGTFVSVLDGRTGATLYSELDPGVVTQLAIAGRQLVIGDETGSPTTDGGIGAWNSVSTVRALTLRSTRTGLAASPAWQYSTGAQWGLLLGLQPVPGGVAIAWSDTPLGLGEPGPPDGHVVLVDGHGRKVWDQRTAGYPVLSRYDASRGELAVVEQTDPTQAVSYTLAGLRLSDGRTVTSRTTTGVLPTALTIGALAPRARSSWVVAGVVSTTSLVEPPYYNFTAATVAAVDPDSAKVQWAHTLANGDQSAPQPGAVEVVPAANGRVSVVVGSWLGSVTPSPTAPITEDNNVQAVSGATGAVLWQQSGDVADPLSLTTAGSTVRGVTEEQDAVSYAPDSGKNIGSAALPGTLSAAITANVNGAGPLDYVAGGESGAVSAFDGSTVGPVQDAPKVLWRTDVGGSVHQIVPATVGGRAVLAVAATTGIALLDQRTGQVLHRMSLPGQYVWNVVVGSAGGRTIVVTATDRVSAFDATTGEAAWTYRPTTAAYFTNSSVVDGVVVAEYQSQELNSQEPTAMAALGINASTGRTTWTAPADPTTTFSAQLRDGIAAGPGIPGAGANGAAFTWLTQDGQGRVDVRDASTGKLLYSNTSGDLGNHESYMLDPSVGLISVGGQGTDSITPSGPTGTPWVSGSGVAVARAGGQQVLLTASAGLNAYPMSALAAGDNLVDPLAGDSTFLPGQVSVTPEGKVLTLPVDWPLHQLISFESGQTVRAYDVGIQQGLALLTLTGSPAANAARHPTMAPAAPVSRPTALPLSTPGGTGIATVQPAAQVEVHGYNAAGAPQLTESAPSGYDPATLRAYLGLHGTGAGQTVAVVDAPGNPNIVNDVNEFSTRFGLPTVCAQPGSSGCFHFTVNAPDGTAATDPSWGLETSMDIEWVHAVAPQATVVLVEAADGTFASLFHSVNVAAQLRPATISMSWGLPEEFTDETYYDHFCQLSGALCVVASGDYGHPGSYPADNPAVLGIGGTTLQLTGSGSVSSETAWASSGGGRSYVEPTPGYQQDVLTGGRGTPDVSFDADPATGVAVYDTTPYNGQTGWFQVGGTSLGAPSWAAIIASADQLRATAHQGPLTAANDAAQRAVYASAGQLGDIVSGPSNGFCPDICTAGPGYDFVTGLGSPRTGLDAKIAATP